MEDFVNVLDVVNSSNGCGFVFNPDFTSVIHPSELDIVVDSILSMALDALDDGFIVNITRKPEIDMLLSVSVSDSGIVKVDAEGCEILTVKELYSTLKEIIFKLY